MTTTTAEYTPSRYRSRLPANIPDEPDDDDGDVAAALAKTPINYMSCQGDGHRWPDLFGEDGGLIWQRVLATWPNGTVRLGAQDRACRVCGLVRTSVYVFYPGHSPRRVGGHTYDYTTAPGYLYTPAPEDEPERRAPTRAEKEAELVRRYWEQPKGGPKKTAPAKAKTTKAAPRTKAAKAAPTAAPRRGKKAAAA